MITFSIGTKYYLIRCDGVKLTGNPGVGDVTKQFLYDYEYRTLLEANGIPCNDKHIYNGFLIPAVVNACAERFCQVKMPWLQKLGGEMAQLPDIQVWKINARWLLSAYNTGREKLNEGTRIFEWLESLKNVRYE